jgi:hypothetical protein
MSTLSISFGEGAEETFENIVDNMRNYCVQVTPQEGEPFDAELLGSGADWLDAVRVRTWDEADAEGKGEPFEVRVKDILVY